VPRHTTTVTELVHAGVLLRTGRHHVLDVMGAFPRLEQAHGPRLHTPPPAPQAFTYIEPTREEEMPSVPDIYYTFDGRIVQIRRDWR
jgi:hypothetical protein